MITDVVHAVFARERLEIVDVPMETYTDGGKSPLSGTSECIGVMDGFMRVEAATEAMADQMRNFFLLPRDQRLLHQMRVYLQPYTYVLACVGSWDNPVLGLFEANPREAYTGHFHLAHKMHRECGGLPMRVALSGVAYFDSFACRLNDSSGSFYTHIIPQLMKKHGTGGFESYVRSTLVPIIEMAFGEQVDFSMFNPAHCDPIFTTFDSPVFQARFFQRLNHYGLAFELYFSKTECYYKVNPAGTVLTVTASDIARERARRSALCGMLASNPQFASTVAKLRRKDPFLTDDEIAATIGALGIPFPLGNRYAATTFLHELFKL